MPGPVGVAQVVNLRVVVVTAMGISVSRKGRGENPRPFLCVILYDMAGQRGRPKKDDKVLILMQSGMGWTTGSGVKFTHDHPFKVVDAAEAELLISTGRFRRAAPDELKAYYSIEN